MQHHEILITKYNKSTAFIMSVLLTTLSIISILSGCSQVKSPVTKTGLYFDTVISITLYEPNSSKLIDECFQMADEYESLFSKSKEGSDVYNINNSENEWVKINEETLSIITKSFEYEEISNGKFSVMCGALTDLWDIGNRTPDMPLPTPDEIKKAQTLCGKDLLEVNESDCEVMINKKGAKLDLGAAAKGYIADKMKEYLVSKGVTSGIIQLGGNVLLIGKNPSTDTGDYSIGIALPFSENSEIATVLNRQDSSIVTSGNYQRFFEKDSSIYHHIIDLSTGYPADTGLNSVTIVCNESLEADILSTVLFLSGKEKGVKILDSLNTNPSSTYEALFISDENEILN